MTALCAAANASAQVVISSATSTQRLDILDASATSFLAPATTTITTTTGAGIEGPNTRAWNLTNEGSVTGATSGVSLATPTAGAAVFTNSGTVRGNGAGTSAAAVYFDVGGTLNQSSTGRLLGNYGVIFNAGGAAGSNAGQISVSRHGVWSRAASSGTFQNAGSILTNGASYDAVRVEGASTLTISGPGSATASGQGGIGLHAVGSGATLTWLGGTASATGSLGRAVQADDGATIRLGANGGVSSKVTTSGSSTIGLLTTSGVIDVANTEVSTSYHGAVAQDTGLIRLGSGTSFLVNDGSGRVGLGAHGGGGFVATAPITVTMNATTNNANARVAAYMHDGGTISFAAGSTLAINSGSGTGLTVDNTALPTSPPITDLRIQLNGPSSVGGTGVFVTNGGVATFNGLTISGDNAGGGMLASGSGSRFVLTGDATHAASMSIVAGSPSYTVLASPDFVPTLTAGFTALNNTSTIAFGVKAEIGASAAVAGANVTVNSPQLGSTGAFALSGGAISLDEVQITASGNRPRGLLAVNGTITGTDATVTTNDNGRAVEINALSNSPTQTPGVVALVNSDLTANGTVGIGFLSLTDSSASPKDRKSVV